MLALYMPETDNFTCCYIMYMASPSVNKQQGLKMLKKILRLCKI